MARPLRVQYPGALYHVISRGNAQQKIFLDDNDRRGFLKWLKDAVKTHNLIIHAYCLMSNHYHLLVETPDGNLSTAMRDLNGNYSQWFNAHHSRVGHLFGGRFKAFIVEKETYLLVVARYIVLNAVRAGLVTHPRLWKWCSFSATAGIAKAPEWLHVDWLLGNFGKKRALAQKAYREFVMDGLDVDPYEDLEHDLILGSPQFVYWIWNNHTAGSETLKEHPREQRIVGRLALGEIFTQGMTKRTRDNAIIFARMRCGYLNTEIARHLGINNSTVGKIIRGMHGEI
ncbi:MAG: transposase [Candidatus Uhrbacteria bacterium]|nr:transposase [Candidatus Uhrbacteria bacterium]